MRVISRKKLREYGAAYPEAQTSLDHWEHTTRHAEWSTPADVRLTFNSVDTATVSSGTTVYIFNIQRNEHRLIAAIHFNTSIVYVLETMTHRDYTRRHWKGQL